MSIVFRIVNDLPQSFQPIKTETISATGIFFTIFIILTVDIPKSYSFVILALIKWIQMFWIVVNRSLAGCSSRLFDAIFIQRTHFVVVLPRNCIHTSKVFIIFQINELSSVHSIGVRQMLK